VNYSDDLHTLHLLNYTYNVQVHAITSFVIWSILWEVDVLLKINAINFFNFCVSKHNQIKR